MMIRKAAMMSVCLFSTIGTSMLLGCSGADVGTEEVKQTGSGGSSGAKARGSAGTASAGAHPIAAGGAAGAPSSPAGGAAGALAGAGGAAAGAGFVAGGSSGFGAIPSAGRDSFTIGFESGGSGPGTGPRTDVGNGGSGPFLLGNGGHNEDQFPWNLAGNGGGLFWTSD